MGMDTKHQDFGSVWGFFFLRVLTECSYALVKAMHVQGPCRVMGRVQERMLRACRYTLEGQIMKLMFLGCRSHSAYWIGRYGWERQSMSKLPDDLSYGLGTAAWMAWLM